METASALRTNESNWTEDVTSTAGLLNTSGQATCELNLFNAPVVSWVRGWPSISFEPEWSPEGLGLVDLIYSDPDLADVPVEIVQELIKIAYATGLIVGTGEHRIGYDGSCVTQVAPECVGRNGDGIRLGDLRRLRSERPASMAEFISLVTNFFRRNAKLLAGFPVADFAEKFRYGVFRMESLYSIPPGFREMDLTGFLKFVEANLWERKGLFGEDFEEVHTSSTIPKDDDLLRCCFKTFGFWKDIGHIDTQWGRTPVFLRIAPSYGECCMGWELAITIANPRSNLFTVGVNMLAEKGGLVPLINKIQTMVLHLDQSLRYRGNEVLADDDLLTRKQFLEIQKNISEQLLGGGDLFYTMIAAIACFYRLREFPVIKGLCGRSNLWLKYHAKEILTKKGQAEADRVRKRAEDVYDKKFSCLGFREADDYWELSREDFGNFLKKALVPYRLTQNEIIPKEVFRGGRTQIKNISLPRYEKKVSISGLNEILKVMDDYFSYPVVFESIPDLDAALVLWSAELTRIEKERKALLIG